jgi:oligopeptide transport system ATP-binding protein
VGGETDVTGHALLELHDLRVELPHDGELVSVLRDVSFTVGQGEIVGLVGESGSGKSLTARSIVRLLPPGARVSGDVLLHGTPIPTDGRRLREIRARSVAMVFQDPRAHIDPLYRNGDHLVEGLRLAKPVSRSAAKQEALRLLARVGIDDPPRVFDAYPGEVSGGMLQRVMIAGALTGDPDLIIADEPTTALDVTTQAEIVALLGSLCREQNRGILFITHNLDLAAAICRRSLVMYAGRIVEENTTAQVFAAPLHPYSARLLLARPSLTARVDALAVIPGRPLSALEAPDGCAFYPRCAFARPECQTWTPSLIAVGSGRSACRRVHEIQDELRSEAALA